ncbi:MAG: 30S ribosomal protein S18 [Candidatus Omnitrophica bacterium]|nr:30S ribosomal protein S18 [Candidatus Omnitrophota bacterium]
MAKFPALQVRKKFCRFCADKVSAIDYKDTKRLERIVSERGKILSVRVTGTCARHQRMLRRAVNKARFLALLPHIK